MQYFISGIQQIGVGIPDVHQAWKWYRQNFGMDVPVFDDKGKAELMLPYTGGQPQERHAILALNMQGGGGFEIWQYRSRTPKAADFNVSAGDLGIFIAKMKTRNIKETYAIFKAQGVNLISEIVNNPNREPHFYAKDPYGNIFEYVESDIWFARRKLPFGGAYGFVVGVSDTDKSINFYKNVLGYDNVVYDKTDTFDDLASIPGGNNEFRRVLLTHTKSRKGPFSRMLNKSYVELLEAKNYSPKKIFENRFWGDLGYIHVCFDIVGMENLKEKCLNIGQPFTVDSGQKFDMGEAAGRFAYVEDPDGALIEFVETYKVPVFKRLGWYINLKKRPVDRPLPDRFLKLMGLSRVKD